jgi:putative acetyltransferase
MADTHDWNFELSEAEPVVLIPGQYVCRLWRPEDREAVCTLIKSILESYGLNYEPNGADEDAALVEEYYFNGKRGEFWVVQNIQGEIVGSSAFYESQRKGKCVEIRKMYLLPDVRGKGLGKTLLLLMERRIKKKGYDMIYLETASVLKEACIMYKKAGYKEVDGVETARCDMLMYKFTSEV